MIANSQSSVIPSAHTLAIPSEARDLGFASGTHGAGPNSTTSTLPWKSGASALDQSSEKEAASAPDPNIWFATGGHAARVFHSSDRGQTWQVFDTPILHGPDSAGIFSIVFRDPTHGVIAGGDYKHPTQDGPNLAFTNDGGRTWTVSQIFPQSYYSAVAYDRGAGIPKPKTLRRTRRTSAFSSSAPNSFMISAHPETPPESARPKSPASNSTPLAHTPPAAP